MKNKRSSVLDPNSFNYKHYCWSLLNNAICDKYVFAHTRTRPDGVWKSWWRYETKVIV